MILHAIFNWLRGEYPDPCQTESMDADSVTNALIRNIGLVPLKTLSTSIAPSSVSPLRTLIFSATLFVASRTAWK